MNNKVKYSFLIKSSKVILWMFIFFFHSNAVLSQKTWSLQVNFSIEESWLNRLNYKENHKDSASVYAETRAIVSALQKRSYFAASVDTLHFEGNVVKAYVFVGEQLNWAQLKKGNMEEDALSKTGYRDKIYNGYRFRYKQFGRFMEGILSYYEDNGYPFVSLRLDSIRNLDQQGIQASLKLVKNKYIEIDTVEVYGGYHVSEKYLYNYLGIRPHKPYNETNIQAISERIDDLSFVSEQQSSRVIFTQTKTSLQMFLKKRRASRFDGIIGLLQDEESGEVQLTGEVNLGLTNAFKRGEVIGLHWRGLPDNTQDLKIEFKYPYLFNSAFGIDADFRLYKRDTTFLDIIGTAGIQYFMNARNYLKVFYQRHTSNLLSTKQYENTSSLPSVLDFKTDFYGGELNFNKLDYTLNPTKGFQVVLTGRAGFKEIKKNSNIEDSLYQDVELNSVIIRGEITFSYFISLAPRHVILLANKSAILDNPQILENEMYRIGGLKILRGFNEESIFASLYAINTLEYRFILDKNSYIMAFTDLAYTEKETFGLEKLIDRPYSFGVGTSFQTNAGIFSLTYAAGSQQGNRIDLRSAKIHFGFINYF